MKKNLLYRKARMLIPAMLAFLVAAVPSGAENLAQNPDARLNFIFRNTELKKILQEVEKQSEYYFVYNHEQVNVDRRMSIRVENEPIAKVLQMLFEGTDVKYEIRGRQIALSPASHTRPGEQPQQGAPPARQQPVVMNSGSQQSAAVGEASNLRTITGRVQDANGQPLVGASVYTPDFATGVATDATGSFSILIPGSTRTLIISMVGFGRVEQAVPGSNHMVVVMKDELQTISEVIVTGYQTLSPERSSGSFSTLPSEVLNKTLDNNILNKLEGAMPGLYLHQGEYRIRGVATLYGNESPLYVIDGYPSTNMSSLNPRDIANVTVLKDAAAASIYGVRGANGVIVITTHQGRSGKMRVHANSSLTIDPITDYSQLDLMNSSELVDYQKTLFDLGHAHYSPNEKYAMPQAIAAMYAHKMGRMSEEQMNATLDRLRKSDNEKQVKDNLAQSKLTQRHALSASGGTDINRYYVSINYEGERGMSKGSTSNSVNVLFKEQVDLAKWVSIEGAITTKLDDGKAGGSSFSSYFGNYAMPYDMLFDDDGELAKMYRFKSPDEVQRLIDLGLHDETSNPITEHKKTNSKNNSLYLRLQGGITLKPMEGLGINVSYQTERTSSHSKTYQAPDSYAVKKLQNDATQIIDGEIVRNIPYGGIMSETRASQRNYTFRVQANFDRVFGGRHFVSALAGAERRSETSSATYFYKLAFDDSRNLYEMLDIKALAAGLKATESVTGEFSHNDVNGNKITDAENRFVSFYANAGYTYDNRYTATVSARMDDTNLFGSDPKYRYLPMWSTGFKWLISNEKFMPENRWLNNLALRVTYGITGNVYHKSGPYLIAYSRLNPSTGLIGTEISSPPNKSLRWEKTAVFNVGIDASMLGNRLNTTLEFYNRNTTDLLATTTADPSMMFTDVMKNFGSLYNRGFEVSVNALAVKAGDFTWQSTLNFSYNFNKITKGNEGNRTVLAYTNNQGVMIEGKSRDALYRFRWAGLNPEYGTIQVYQYATNEDGSKGWKVLDNLNSQNKPAGQMGTDDIESLVYSGTTRPKWTLGFVNTFTWKSLSLTIHIIGNGGHVMLDALPGVLNTSNFSINSDKRAMNFWREPGDEKKKGVMPAPSFSSSDGQYMAMWYASDRHVMPADFLKVRNITLNYELPHKWFGKALFSSAQLTLQVRNAFCWARNRENIDPETLSYSPSTLPIRVPLMPRYMIGLDFTF